MDVSQGVELIGYADDLAVLVTAKRREVLQLKANIALVSVTNWIEGKELRQDRGDRVGTSRKGQRSGRRGERS